MGGPARTRRSAIAFAIAAGVFAACDRDEARSASEALCSESWYRAIEEKVPTGDGQGHGPDVGSDEWKSVVEFKLGVRGEPDVPERNGDAWCRHIDRIVRSAAGPSFACGDVAAGSVEAMVCEDEALSARDRRLAEVYAAAAAKATDQHPPVLAAQQRGWIKGRDECWKSEDPHGCVRDAYVRRVAELQAWYRLVPFDGPVHYACDDDPANEVVATYFQTDPPTLIAERGDSVSLMFLRPSGSGSRYQGRNESLWEHQGEASITWGYGAPEMQCRKATP